MAIERFDGFPVDVAQGKLSGKFDLDASELNRFGLDAEVMLVVIGRVKSASISETPTGDIVRVNTIGVREVGLVRSEQMRRHLAETLGLEVPQPSLFDALPGDNVSTEVGTVEAGAGTDVRSEGPAREIGESLLGDLPEITPNDLVRQEAEAEMSLPHDASDGPSLAGNVSYGEVRERRASKVKDPVLAKFLAGGD